MNIIGTIKLKPVILYTKYFWGPDSDIAGKKISVVDKASNGDCLCIIPEKGLVDVDVRDIEIS
jgi:hypothetical protein